MLMLWNFDMAIEKCTNKRGKVHDPYPQMKPNKGSQALDKGCQSYL